MDVRMTQQPTAGLQTLDYQVLEHSHRWQLVGIYLRCTACGAGQKASDGNMPFVHEITCFHAARHHYPWQDLACILHWVPSQNIVAV